MGDVIILLCAMVVIGAAVLCQDVCCCQYHMSIQSMHVVSQECVCCCGLQVPQKLASFVINHSVSSLMKEQFVVTPVTQFYRTPRTLDHSLTDEHLSMLCFHESIRTAILPWTQHFDRRCVCSRTV